MRSRLRYAVVIAGIAIASIAHAQQRPPIADPFHAHLVEGRVLGPRDAPVAGVVVERVMGPDDDMLYSTAFRETTDARGAFRFEFHGLGLSSGRTWHLAVRRPGCPVVIQTAILERRVVPGVGREGDVATGVVLRVPACTPR